MSSNAGEKIFISYTQADRNWAEWIAWQLEEAGYETVLQAWHFGPGSNFVREMHQAAKTADRIVAVLSPEYERSAFCVTEWASAFVQDATGDDRKLVPIRVQPYQPSGLLASIVYVDVVDRDEATARRVLLEGLRGARKPDTAPHFPGRQPRGESPPRFPGTSHQLWLVPYRRNPYFVGREDVLEKLRQSLTQDGAAALGQTQSISGLGGIGKTQTAVEYAYRYRDDYEAVFFIRADTEAEILSGFGEIARRLDAGEAQDQEQLVDAVLAWLGESTGWLLIFDNADKLDILHSDQPLRARTCHFSGAGVRDAGDRRAFRDGNDAGVRGRGVSTEACGSSGTGHRGA